MQIILQEDVEKLGTRGEVVEVAEGYARNFLLPRKLALEASAGNMKRLGKDARHVRQEGSHREGRRDRRSPNCSPAFRSNSRARPARTTSCSARSRPRDISDALAAKGFTIDKRKITLAEPIKVIGEYEIPVKLHREVTATVKLDGQERRVARLFMRKCS